MAEAKTTFGSTNASSCYRESLAPFSDYGLRFCTDAIRQDDLLLRDRAATYTNRGIIYAAHGKLDAAMADHNEALLLSPDKGKVYVNRGNVCRLIIYRLIDNDHVRGQSSVQICLHRHECIRGNMPVLLPHDVHDYA